MRKVLVGSSGLRVSELGFGCSQIMGWVGRKRSLRALSAAYDRGVTYFDVARSYGYGEAESLVGEFLRGKREQVVLATKFGIESQRPTLARRVLKNAARPLLKRWPTLRAAARRRLATEFDNGRFGLTQMRASFERSLKALGTDHVDILLLHGCTASDVQGDLLEELHRLVLGGKVGYYGLATDWTVVAELLPTWPKGPSVVQGPFGLTNLHAARTLTAAASGGLAAIAHSPFGGGAATIGQIRSGLAQLQQSPSTSPVLREKLAPQDSLLADVALNSALRGTGASIVLAAMYDEGHIEQNVRACEGSRFTPQELTEIRRHFAGVG
jgi:aryl-alcohol dehydrogenase-like predicted oxidoreductase